MDVQMRAVLGLNIAMAKQVADSKTGVVASRADKVAFPSAKISGLIYTIHNFYVLLTVHLSIILDNDQIDIHLFYFTIRLL